MRESPANVYITSTLPLGSALISTASANKHGIQRRWWLGPASANIRSLGMKPNRAEFEQLALEQLDTLYRLARRLTRNAATAEDLVQETYLRALKGQDGFVLQAYGIRPWLIRIMHNLWSSTAQRQQRAPQAVENEQLESAASGTAPPLPINLASNDAMDERLVNALERLPAEYQSVMHLWAIEDCSYQEIADALDVPIGTVMSRLHRARARLSQELQALGKEAGFIRE